MRVSMPAHVLFAEQQVVRSDLGADATAPAFAAATACTDAAQLRCWKCTRPSS